MSNDLIDWEPIERKIRGITPDTFAFWKYGTGRYRGSSVHVANHYRSGVLVGQKLRTKDKDFRVKGEMDPLYGMWLWGSGKKLVITEGELDALSMSQAQGNRWPVVSVPNGAQGAVKAIGRSIEYLQNFEEIILMFDQDKPGQAAALECAKILPLGKAKIASLPLKDPNEMLMAGRTRELITAMWNAEPYRPDGVVSLDSIIEEALKPPEWGEELPYPTMTALTYGIRKRECWYWGAGVGVGKTDNFMEIMSHLINKGHKVGALYLEQPVPETAKRLAGKLDSTLYHLPDAEYDEEKLRGTLHSIRDQVYLYDHFGSTDWDSIADIIRFLKHGCGVDYIFLDHLTALASHAQDERRELDRVCAEISSLCQSLDIWMGVISHLTTPQGEAHEEGGRVKEKHFTGSRAIARWAHFMIGLERDKQSEDEADRHVTTVRILKDRYTGKATGKTFPIRYDQETGRLTECDHLFDKEMDWNGEEEERDPF